MKKSILVYPLFTLLMIFGITASNVNAQNLILNPGFENNTLGTGCQTNQPAAIVTASLDNITAFYGGVMDGIDIGVNSACYAGGANSGTTHIVMAGLSAGMFESISFDLSSPIVSGQTYTLTFYAANSNPIGSESLSVGVSTGAASFGTQAVLVPLGTNVAYTQYSTTFTAPISGSYLTVEPAVLGDFWFGLDDFSLELSCIQTSNNMTLSSCDSYTVPSGDETYFTTGIYNDTIPNIAGCDSVLIIDLTVNTVDASVTQTGTLLTANEVGASYQWLDCPGMTLINGATNQSFTAASNGDYAVIVNNNGCSDTSTCYTVSGVGINENDFNGGFLLYPNPTKGDFSINLGENYQFVTITMTDLSGKIIKSKTHNGGQIMKLNLEEPAGVYFLMIESEDKKAVIKLVKE